MEKSLNMLSAEQQNKAALSFIKLVVEEANLSTKKELYEDKINEEFAVSIFIQCCCN